MSRSFLLSALFHIGVGLLLIVGLANLGRELPPETFVTVDIVTADAAEAPPAAAPQAAAAPLPSREAASPAPPPPPPPAPEPEPRPEPQPTPTPAPPPPPPPPPPPSPEPPKPPPPAPPLQAPEPTPDPVPPPKPQTKVEPPKPVEELPKAEPPKPEPPKVTPRVQRKPDPPKEPEPKQAAEAEKKPEPPKPEPPKPAEPVKKAEPAKKPEPAPEPKEDSFAALLRNVEKLDKRVQAPETRQGKGTAPNPGTAGARADGQQVAQISASQLAGMISRQVTPCWRIPIGAQGGERMRAELNIVINPDGNVRSVTPLDEARIAADPVFRAFAESAVRAVRACSPLQLPPESYQQWRNVIFNFDPSLMAG